MRTKKAALLKSHVIQLGKPMGVNFSYAEKALLERNRRKYEDKGEEVKELEKVYMIGDTVETDIAGTTSYNKSKDKTKSTKIPWESILVETGEYETGIDGQMADKVVH